MGETSPYISVKAAAEWASTSTDVIYEAIASGELRHVRIGRGQRVIRTKRAWVEDMMERRASGGATEPLSVPA